MRWAYASLSRPSSAISLTRATASSSSSPACEGDVANRSEPDVVHGALGVCLAAFGNPAVAGDPAGIVPTPAAHHAKGSLLRTVRIPRRGPTVIMVLHTIHSVMPIPTPFPYVAGHVVQSVVVRIETPHGTGVRLWSHPVCWMASARWACVVLDLVGTPIVRPGMLNGVGVAPRKPMSIYSTPCRFLPFRLSRQPVAVGTPPDPIAFQVYAALFVETGNPTVRAVIDGIQPFLLTPCIAPLDTVIPTDCLNGMLRLRTGLLTLCRV
jgi:hypothetical protein